MKLLFVSVLWAEVSLNRAKDSGWLWQFVDDEQQDTLKLRDREIARFLGENGGEGEGEGEGEGAGGGEDRNDGVSAPTDCLEVGNPGKVFEGFFKPVFDTHWYLVSKGSEETSGGTWCPYSSDICETVTKSTITSTDGFFVGSDSVSDLATRIESQYLKNGGIVPGAGTFCRRKHKDDVIAVTYSFGFESSRSVDELSKDKIFKKEMKILGLKILGLPSDKFDWITVSFLSRSKHSDFVPIGGRRLSDSVLIDYTAEIPIASVVNVSVVSDSDALEAEVLAAVEKAEIISGISYDVTVDRASIIALTNNLKPAWTDAVTEAVPLEAPTPEPTAAAEPTHAPAPAPTQAPAAEATPSPVTETSPEPKSTPEPDGPSASGPTSPPTAAPTTALKAAEGFSNASVRNSSAVWNLCVAVIALAYVARRHI